jgi:septal ring factor EnvC (AmiA/AmiB activator)
VEMMNEEAIKERLNSVDKEIEKHEKRISSLEKTYSIMEKMDYRVTQIEKAVASIDSKIDEQNDDKGKKWDKLIDYIFYFIIAALLGYVIHQIGLK